MGKDNCQGCRDRDTVVQTLRLQQRPIRTYLQRAVEAHRAGLPAPKLLLSA